MKYTLLQMTQDILSNLSSDEVNSISDNAESMQVATIIKQKYYDIASRGMLPEHNQVFQLNPSLDETSPVLMYVPDGIGQIEYIKYFDSNPADGDILSTEQHDLNVDIKPTILSFTSTTSNTIGTGTKTWTVLSGLSVGVGNTLTVTSGSNSMTGTVATYASTSLTMNITSSTGSGTFTSWTFTFVEPSQTPGYQYVTMLPIKQFLELINQFNPADQNVESFTFSDTSNNFPGKFTFYYFNDKQPQYCCILSNYYVIFDSYDSTQDSTLQGNKSLCFGQVVPTFQMVDTFIPDLDAQQFPLLLNEAKSLAYYELKQQPHPLASQEVRRQWTTVQKNKSINNRPRYFDELPNFGRRRAYYGFKGAGTTGYQTSDYYIGGNW